MEAINYVEYDDKAGTPFIRLVGESPKYTIEQRIAMMGASEATAEALQELISFLIHDGLGSNPRLIPIINRGTKALKSAGVAI